MAEYITKNIDGVRCTAITSGGVDENINRLDAGKADIGLVSTGDSHMAFNGMKPYTKKYDKMRGMGILFANWGEPYTLKKSGIKTYLDLKGKKICGGAPGGSMHKLFFDWVRIHGLDPEKDMEIVFLPARAAVDALKLGQIDAAMQHKAGMPMGPFMLSDLIGLDIVHNILKTFEDQIGPEYAPHEKIIELFDSRKLGRKTGEGFYSYAERPVVTEDQAKGFDVKLLLEPFVREAEKLFKEAVATVEDIDTAMKLGANIPKGPFEMKKAGLGEEKPVLTEKKNGVYKITLNRPSKLNSITLEMLGMISDAVDEASADTEIKAILITGAGDRAFCVGADVSQFPGLGVEDARKVSKAGHNTFRKFMETPKPVVAAVNGYALGGGNELILFCDLRVASDKARFSQPEVSLGLIPGWGGTYLLKKLVGKTVANDLIMTGRRINADEAKSIGLISHVYPAAEFKAKVNEYLQALVNGPPRSISAMKKLSASDDNLDATLEAEADAFADLWNYDELKEGIDAYNNRRKPVFKGE